MADDCKPVGVLPRPKVKHYESGGHPVLYCTHCGQICNSKEHSTGALYEIECRLCQTRWVKANYRDDWVMTRGPISRRPGSKAALILDGLDD